MKPSKLLLIRSSWHAALIAFLLALPTAAADRVNHDLTIELDPATGQLDIVDVVKLPEGAARGEVEFLLNSAFTVLESTPNLERLPAGEIGGFFSINASPELLPGLELARYRLTGAPVDGVITISYGGIIDFGLSDQKEEYTRGFRETAGIVSEEGVYLAGPGYWYPFFGDELVEFSLDVSVPEGWHLISQGNGTSLNAEGRSEWDSGGGVDEIFLVGGPLLLYSDSAGAVEALVYLRETDDALAAKYLEATARYVEMYRDLLGPYPYGKFALVENFWETGYGMPSFTLLGPQVIRFPFILNSSYPHEILHNWWGNSVFVEFSGGNWCEGLTAYLADHLIQEQRGTATEYRRSTLQKYRNYVQAGEDFPLTEFRSRHSAATEAIGYGKTLMMFHMLRHQIGDEAFSQGLARFYRKHRGQRAGFDDLRVVFEETSGAPLETFFSQWVERPGALDVRPEVDPLGQDADGNWLLSGRLIQTQDQPYRLPFEILVQHQDGTVSTIAGSEMSAEQLFGSTYPPDRQPIAVHFDPSFDLFRVLDPREIPPSIGQIFGDPEILAVLPSDAPDEEIDAYRALMEGWQSDSHAIEMTTDAEIQSLPAERSLWILGSTNRFASLFTDDEGGVATLDGESITLADETVALADHSLVVIRRHPQDLESAIGWLVVEPAAAFPGMGRKLPHYGKYSYLAFEGDEPTNVVKGQWDTADSPLVVDLRPEGERKQPLPPLALEERRALAELPPAFSEKRLMEHVAFLAAEEMAGRGPGSTGAEQAARYIAEAFEAVGLEPGGEDGTYFQPFTIPEGPDGSPVDIANVIGIIPGAKDEWGGQSVMVSAHYDHLGHGWPDVHQGDEGKAHLGADDNASGVAVLLELARALAEGEQPGRNIFFVAFSGEEAGRAGSQFFVEKLRPEFLAGLRGVVNLDTVGRLFDGKVQVLGTGTADEWQHIFRGASYVTGVPSRNVPGSVEASDQMSFIDKGIPGVQLFTGAHDDYHRPGDTVDKIDSAGLVKVATLAKEAVVYLGGREEPLTVTIEGVGEEAEAGQPGATGGPPGASSRGPTGGRKVRIGTIPDFGFQGPGVKVDSVGEDSPAAKAGIQPGDVILTIDDAEITDLRTYSDVIRTLEESQEVAVVVDRSGEEVTLTVVVEAR